MPRSKVATLDQALAKCHDGMTVMLGGFTNVGSPNKFCRALADTGIKDLHTVSYTHLFSMTLSPFYAPLGYPEAGNCPRKNFMFSAFSKPYTHCKVPFHRFHRRVITATPKAAANRIHVSYTHLTMWPSTGKNETSAGPSGSGACICFQLFSSNVAPQERQWTVMRPFPRGTRICWPQLGHLK